MSIPVTGSGDALVFHLHGASGHRAEVVTVPRATGRQVGVRTLIRPDS